MDIEVHLVRDVGGGWRQPPVTPKSIDSPWQRTRKMSQSLCNCVGIAFLAIGQFLYYSASFGHRLLRLFDLRRYALMLAIFYD
jgi:hypothetical protein